MVEFNSVKSALRKEIKLQKIYTLCLVPFDPNNLNLGSDDTLDGNVFLNNKNFLSGTSLNNLGHQA